jgi:hypothetical protein
MKICVFESDIWKTTIRISPFLKLLSKRGHDIVYSKEKYKLNECDIILIQYESLLEINTTDYLTCFNKKLVIYSCDDISRYDIVKFDENLISKIDVWITFEIHKNNKYELENKLILFPRFNWYTIEELDQNQKKENKLFMWISTTGYLNYNNKNLRVELFRKLKESDKLKKFLVGGIAQSDLVDVKDNTHISDYNNTYSKYVSYYADYNLYLSEMRKCSICICPIGNSKWGPRHIDAMSSKSIIISSDIRNDPGYWEMQEDVYNNVVLMKDDLTDIEQVCEDVLMNVDKYQYLTENMYSIYENYFKLDKFGLYNEYVNLKILKDFEDKGVIL